MKTLIATLALALAMPALAQELVELKLPNSSKVVVKLMFRNGSICDPKGKEGLTFLTANLVAQGGTAEMTFCRDPGRHLSDVPGLLRFGGQRGHGLHLRGAPGLAHEVLSDHAGVDPDTLLHGRRLSEGQGEPADLRRPGHPGLFRRGVQQDGPGGSCSSAARTTST